jgi:hypothetical protein
MDLKYTLMAGVAAMSLLSGEAFAQQATLVTPTGTINGPGAFTATAATNTTSCNVTNDTSASDTITITPGSNQYVYITGFYLDITADVTGVTAVTTASYTNVPGSPIYSLATVVPTTGQTGTFRQISETYNPPIRSQTPGTNVTWLPSAAASHVIFCPRITYYLAQ